MKKTWIVVIVIIALIAGYLSSQFVARQSANERAGVTQKSNTTTEQQSNTTNKFLVGSSLDLSGKNLTSIPSDIFGRTSLVELNISNNSIKGSIQGEIRMLKNLRILNASNNQMTGVPAEIGQLENLEILNLSNNHITGLPLELGNLKKIKTIILSGNDYSKYDLDIIRGKLPSVTFILD